eukprot:1802719-Prymnesium_polylepis.1
MARGGCHHPRHPGRVASRPFPQHRRNQPSLPGSGTSGRQRSSWENSSVVSPGSKPLDPTTAGGATSGGGAAGAPSPLLPPPMAGWVLGVASQLRSHGS